MPVWVNPNDSPTESQWDLDSRTCQSTNCGPASVEKVANYYRNLSSYGIQRNRRLVRSTCGGTNLAEQKRMLVKRGVASEPAHLSVDQVKARLRTGRWPLVLWLVMSYVWSAQKGNTFRGRHALAATGTGYGMCVRHRRREAGIWVNEPNVRRGVSAIKRFFPDCQWIPAYRALGSWVVSPTRRKAVSTTATTSTRIAYVHTLVVTATAGCNFRSGPGTNYSLLPGRLIPKGTRIKSNVLEKAGGAYKIGSATYRTWVHVYWNGRWGWVASRFTKIA